MSTPNDSAAAYDRLAIITAQAEIAEKISVDFLKLKRAIETLQSDLFLLEDRDVNLIGSLEQMEAIAIDWRRKFREIADDKSSRALALNERIQNGVYNG